MGMQGEDVAQKTQLFCRMMIGGFPAWICTTVLVKVNWLQHCTNTEMPLSGACEPTWVCVHLHELLMHRMSGMVCLHGLCWLAQAKAMLRCPLPAELFSLSSGGWLSIAAPQSVAAWAVQVMQVQNKMWPPALTTCEAS